jgi:hypothetical protein
MKALFQSLLLSIGALALAGTALAQVPSSNDTSDGNSNTGMGTGALGGPTAPFLTGQYNTASGFDALNANTRGAENTASGYQALYSNTVGDFDTAFGTYALYSNTNSNSNTAFGDRALTLNTTGADNTASGDSALYSNIGGNDNTASGYHALYSNTSGSNNIAEGYQAGMNLTTGSNNIDIGNVGLAAESDTIRIGTKGTHKATVIAGINTSHVTGSAVYVTTSGRLGVLASSERYKTAIAPIGDSTEKLQMLRPVSFHLKADPKGAVQYGLIAEEVAKVYPELVIRDGKGRIEGVRYDELAPMLLNEVQKRATEISALKQQLVTQSSQLQSTQQQVTELQDLKQELHAALAKLQSKDELVAQR